MSAHLRHDALDLLCGSKLEPASVRELSHRRNHPLTETCHPYRRPQHESMPEIAFESLDGGGHRGNACAQDVACVEETVVLCDHHEALQSLPAAVSDESGHQNAGDGGVGGEVGSRAAGDGAYWDAVVAGGGGERFGFHAELPANVGHGPLFGDVFGVEPVGIYDGASSSARRAHRYAVVTHESAHRLGADTGDDADAAQALSITEIEFPQAVCRQRIDGTLIGAARSWGSDSRCSGPR